MNISESRGSPVYWKLPFMSSFPKEGTGGALIAAISALCVCRESNWQVVKSAPWPSEWDEPNGSVNEGRCERKSCWAERTSEATPLHTQAPPRGEKRWKNKNEINIIFYFCNERDRNFMFFMFCTTIQISLNCYGSLIIPTSKQCHVCLAPERDNASARLSRRWFQETWSAILRCICMNGSVLWENDAQPWPERCKWAPATCRNLGLSQFS